MQFGLTGRRCGWPTALTCTPDIPCLDAYTNRDVTCEAINNGAASSGTYSYTNSGYPKSCPGATFITSSVQCLKWGCPNASFTDSTVTCGRFGCADSSFTGGNITCKYLYSCSPATFVNPTLLTCAFVSSCDIAHVTGGVISCAVDYSCGGTHFMGTAIVTCATTNACQGATFDSTVTCNGIGCPTV